ncbi:thiol peroxidase [Haoranjiania flava]|uniref:Thiol peroxidase n=1 Tax=Haoranjiania flava TaxID=1856322 RepID=A0AAE3IQ83_9BACT|nr:thiol peroxidase [Haoranjiania flava]MCU7695151.1 thiol peroxidase [Haoranjiania flava]
MAQVSFKGNNVHTAGDLPQVGEHVKDFTLVDVDLNEKKLSDYSGKYVVMNIFPSVNTGVCATSVRKFNEQASSLNNTKVLCISKDLPFAQKNFCAAEGLNNVEMLSDFRTDFGNTYGVQLTDGPLQGLLSRAVIVVDPEGKVVYTEQVPEITTEPDYDAALESLK